MADRTLNGFARTAGCYKCLSFFDAAYRHIRNESGRVVAQFGPLQVFRRLNDPVIDQFRGAGGQRK